MIVRSIIRQYFSSTLSIFCNYLIDLFSGYGSCYFMPFHSRVGSLEPLIKELLSDDFIEREFTLVAVDEPPLTLLFKKKGRRQRFRNQLIPERCTLLRRRRLSQPLPYDKAFCDCYRRYSSSSCLFSIIRLPTCTQTTQMLCLKIRLLTHWRILVVVAWLHQSAKHERQKKAPSGSLELVTP